MKKYLIVALTMFAAVGLTACANTVVEKPVITKG
ncbi:hypothetical protein GJW-30_1_02404 [Variibacter gotjawalensis]|jgi:hypothetical protein|uniref:Uncharacterized protein n=1 Tax=Variibacter gotjawalensis TaxID=1333996 RepID=A0A0S3PVD2_9BRAD|nr:putative small secreted protein [Variibacter gotjawalensis]RZS47617.1 hypothetical protein EV661_0007 [Variibacter gotjawalensis]BAT59869.1 hypothetical protein GJW-30_1_02404 [Variibacter gotjawalensis]